MELVNQPNHEGNRLSVHDISKAYYDLVAPIYEKHQFFTPTDARAVFRFIEGCHEREIKNLIDFGCGSGNTTTHLSDHGFTILGGDQSTSMISLATQHHARTDISYRVATFDELLEEVIPHRPQGFMFYYALVHTPRAEFCDLFRELHLRSAPGSLVLMALHYGEPTIMRSPLTGHELPLHSWTQYELHMELHRLGFSITFEEVRAPQSWEFNNEKAVLILRRK